MHHSYILPHGYACVQAEWCGLLVWPDGVRCILGSNSKEAYLRKDL